MVLRSGWSLVLWIVVLAPTMFSLPLLAADRYYGVAEDGILMRLETADEPVGLLHVFIVDKSGRSRQLIPAQQLEPSGGSATTLQAIDSPTRHDERVIVSFDNDGGVLKWLQPSHLQDTNGSIVGIAGDHPLLADETRKAFAEKHFEAADHDLNECYNQLRRSMPAEEFAELRNNQRDWLKYRDHFVPDGDDWSANGPGSIPFLQSQTRRARERTAFLRALPIPASPPESSEGIYGDGIGWELRLGQVLPNDKQRFFILENRYRHSKKAEATLPILMLGRALPDAEGNFRLLQEGADNRAQLPGGKQCKLLPAEDRRSLVLVDSSHPPHQVRLYRLHDLVPATAPMGDILSRLPAEIFDNTTDGLSAEEQMELVSKGAAGSFTLREQGVNSLCIGYRDGKVDLCRFPAVDGGAIVGVTTSNLRARTFQLWRLPLSHGIPKEWPLAQALPQLGAADFFPDPSSNAAAAGLLDYVACPDSEEIAVSWVGPADSEDADVSIRLVWDGQSFSVFRSRRDR